LYRGKDGGVEWKKLTEEGSKKQVLSNSQILELAELVIKIENHYGFPCDIEWAYEDNKFYIVQSRPITTLKREVNDVGTETINLVKEHSREYSIAQINSYCEIINKIKKETGCQIENELFLYNPKIKLVSIYHQPQELKNLFKAVGTLAMDKLVLKKIISDFEQSLSDIKPYLENKKVVRNIEEFNLLYDLFFRFYLGIAYVWVLPLLEYLPEKVKEVSLKLREKTEKYSSRRDQVLINNLKIIYPEVEDLVKYLSIDEIRRGKITEELISKLKERADGFIYYRDNIYQGKLYEEFFENNKIKLDDQVLDKDINKITGSVGFRGVAKGFVRLIFAEKDLNNFKEGEILVSPMTRPEFLSVMQKALAFVTDEGGITCHAAIIAREMKKPCIISTKIATQVLKDGDLVEVDADNGVVRILERSEKLVGENDKANKKFELDPDIWSDSFNWKYGAYPFFTSVYTKLNTEEKNKYETDWKYFLNYFKDGQLNAYLPKKEVIDNGRLIISELLNGNENFLNVFNDYHDKINQSLCICQKYLKSNSNKFEEIWFLVQDSLSNAAKILFNFDYGLDDYFKELQKDDIKLFEIINSNIAEEKESFISEASKELIKLAKENPNDFDMVYETFLMKYGWFQNSYKGVFNITKDWLLDFYNKNKKILIPYKKQKIKIKIDSKYNYL
jgi:phosphohistidine swiveling domain-containing protein